MKILMISHSIIIIIIINLTIEALNPLLYKQQNIKNYRPIRCKITETETKKMAKYVRRLCRFQWQLWSILVNSVYAYLCRNISAVYLKV